MAIVVQGTFTTANTTSGLPNTETGNLAWSYSTPFTDTAPSWGVNTNRAYAPSASGADVAHVNTTYSDNIKISLDLPSGLNAVDEAGIIFRYASRASYLKLLRGYPNQITLVQHIGTGDFNSLGSFAGLDYNNAIKISVILSGSSITVQQNDVTLGTITSTVNQTATRHGMSVGGQTAVYLDNFVIDTQGGGGGTNYPVSVSDSVTITESLRKAASKTRSDSLTPTEALTKAAGKTANDSVAVSDTLSKLIAKAKSDSLTFTDSITSIKGKAVNLSDSVTVTDSAIIKNLAKLQTDSISLTDSDRNDVFKRLADNVTITDSATAFGGKSVVLSDSVTITDSIRKAAGKSVNDSLAPVDTFSRVAQVSKAIFDSLATVDSLSIFLPNAPVLAGIIDLKAVRNLSVILDGKSAKTVNLQGERNQTVNLRGEIL